MIILNGDISLLCVGLTAEIGKYRKKVHILISSVELLKNNGKGLGNLQNKLVPTPFI